MPSTRMLLLAFCLLPLFGFSFRGGRPAYVASFISSCDASDPRPRLRTHYTAPGRPVARPDSAAVGVYARGAAPSRKYAVIGDVNVLASGSRTSVEELTDWAKRGARQLGGDALVDLSYDDAASVKPAAGPVGQLYLTATVVRWE